MRNKKDRGKYWRKNRKEGSMIATLNFLEYSPFPKVLYGIKSNTNEKDKGMLMIDAIQHNFSIDDIDMDQFRMELKKKEEKDFAELNIIAIEEKKEEVKKKGLKDEQPKFKRDEKGNIISPFATKKDWKM